MRLGDPCNGLHCTRANLPIRTGDNSSVEQLNRSIATADTWPRRRPRHRFAVRAPNLAGRLNVRSCPPEHTCTFGVAR